MNKKNQLKTFIHVIRSKNFTIKNSRELNSLMIV